MPDAAVDSSVVAKWILPEPYSAQAQRVLTDIATSSGQVILLDLAVVEVANVIWKRFHRGLATMAEARQFLVALIKCPARIEPSIRLLHHALEIAMKHDRALYDAVFVALAQSLNVQGVTADEPLYRAVHADHPNIILLRDWPPSA